MSDTTELLDSVRDIHEPAPPESSSALIISAFIFLAIAFAIAATIMIFKHKRKANRQLQAEIESIQYESTDTALVKIAILLRRIMYHIHGEDINQLEGHEWLLALDNTFETRYFTEGAGRVLGTDIYKNNTKDKTDTYALCQHISKLIGKTSMVRAT